MLSLLGLIVSSFLLYEYNLSGPVFCPVGGGCDIVRASAYSHILGIPIPVLGIIFYLVMATLAVVHTHELPKKLVRKLQLLIGIAGVGFGVYLTFLEAFVIKAVCFWCLLSFIISLAILLLVIWGRKKTNEYGN